MTTANTPNRPAAWDRPSTFFELVSRLDSAALLAVPPGDDQRLNAAVDAWERLDATTREYIMCRLLFAQVAGTNQLRQRIDRCENHLGAIRHGLRILIDVTRNGGASGRPSTPKGRGARPGPAQGPSRYADDDGPTPEEVAEAMGEDGADPNAATDEDYELINASPGDALAREAERELLELGLDPDNIDFSDTGIPAVAVGGGGLPPNVVAAMSSPSPTSIAASGDLDAAVAAATGPSKS
jgi:hypothetical protein